MASNRLPPPTSELLGTVESLCPICLKRVSGQYRQVGEQVLLEKACPQHGSFAAVVWRGEPDFRSWLRPKIPWRGGSRRPVERGCPLDCGLCENHGQRTCTVLVEITSRCNLGCPVCFADSGSTAVDPGIDELQRLFVRVMEQTGGCNLQLSGGEPTVRDDLAEVVRRAVRAGFEFVQLNTNGLRFVEDPELAHRLKDAGLSSVFLQFDGVTEHPYTLLRGRPLYELKCRAVDALASAGLGIVLVPTISRKANLDQLFALVGFGVARLPQVRGVHFQPLSLFGRYPAVLQGDHVTLPELMRGLVEQSGGRLAVADFHPPGCEHALCSFSARYLVHEDHGLQRLGSGSCDCRPLPAAQGAATAIAVTARQWTGVTDPDVAASAPRDDLDRFLGRARSHTFSISAMAFQDAWTLSLERLRGCCIHVAQPDGRLVPFCSYNLTAADGTSLHRTR
ncbi:radical SAM (seleno)protein TrsS [Desulfofustis limnaeus]|jgi:uncharacterized radical SAM superfamily Fe-S cluster-containing enzyme|uniref:Radical SAM protein n=1 Tax=Desulfofustis limnaeus TaxID=2740163 RepID=A0ABN6M060_9BACT|nr:radical SAM (seleno)protein TrsS [Desulfofustis limnaeus]MDX9895792.1 radical SAM protein [Desulfofustis sp.]BDD86272.1 radical SAM protein [Desulfofustis limnaeus]